MGKMDRRMFARREHEVPRLNTTSLPDLIFTVLFFFMIVTHMRDVDLKVRYEVPQGTEVLKLAHKSAVSYIYVGHLPGSDEFGIQLNDKVCTLADIEAWLDEEHRRMSSEDLAHATVSIKADRDVPLYMIADIKQALRKNYALKVNYSASERPQP